MHILTQAIQRDLLDKHNFAFIAKNGAYSPGIKGIMRKDESAAIVSHTYKPQVEQAFKLRYYKTAFEINDYVINHFYRDMHRPITKWLIKPIVLELGDAEKVSS